MDHKKLFPVFFVIALASFFLLAACQKQPGDFVSGFVTPQGVRVEQLFSADAFLIFKGGASDQQQKDNLAALGQKFPTDLWEKFYSGAAAEFEADFQKIGYSFKEDFLPAIMDAQLMISIDMPRNDSEDPDIFVAMLFADPDKVEDMFRKSRENDQGKKQSYKDHIIYGGGDSGSFITRHEDLFLVSNSLPHLKDVLDRTGVEGTLLAAPGYQQSIAKSGSHFAFVYVNERNIIDSVSLDPRESQEMKKISDSPLMKFVAAQQGEIYFLAAESDGIRINGYSFADPEKLKNAGLDYTTFLNAPVYLYKNIPGDGVMLYSESANFAASINSILGMYEQHQEVKSFIAALRQGLTAQGFDLDKDILGFMDKGYALTLADKGMLLPQVSLLFDASSEPAGAKKSMAKVSEGADYLVASILKESPQLETAMGTEKISDDEKMLFFDLGKLPREEENVPEQVTALNLQLRYGVDSSNLAYFDFRPSPLDGESGALLPENEEFRKAMEMVPGYDRNLTYIDSGTMVEYLRRLVQFGALQGDIDDQEMSNFEAVMSYIVPVKSIVFAARQPLPHEMEVGGFIHIDSTTP
ncbi:MAG TPA: DUF3352 domain-containing protein [Candidatus Gracilibacteria bacterium]|nr:DUF3352 domain-containing protein [Candidatus Gracilibacteria bacterium]